MPGYVAQYLGRGDGGRAGGRGWSNGEVERQMSVGSASTTRSCARPKLAFGRRAPEAVRPGSALTNVSFSRPSTASSVPKLNIARVMGR